MLKTTVATGFALSVLVASSMGQRAPLDDYIPGSNAPGDGPTQTQPGTGTPGYQWESMLDCGACENLMVLDPFALSPVYYKIVIDERQLGGRDQVTNCSSLHVKRKLNWEYTRTHSWSVSGSVTYGIEFELQTGLAAIITAHTKAKTDASATIGGVLSATKTHALGGSLEFDIPPCLRVFVEEYYEDYSGKAWQPQGTIHTCQYDDPSGGPPVTAACFDAEETFTASGKGGEVDDLFIDDEAPCEDDCEDPREPGAPKDEIERIIRTVAGQNHTETK